MANNNDAAGNGAPNSRPNLRNRNSNSIRGPSSALTHFLAAHNIDANQIRRDHEDRVRRAEQEENGEGPSEPAPPRQDEDEAEASSSSENGQAQRKRKRQQAAAIDKIKQGKKFAKKKKQLKGEPGEDDDDEIALSLYEKAKPAPGQLENCEQCGKRFTVTAYSAEGPEGGLLCTPCSKMQQDEKKKADRNKKAMVVREKRRKIQSNLLDGQTPHGAKSLKELCVEKVARHINEVDELGDLPPRLLDRLSQILSRRRILTSRSVDLFLGGDRESVAIYDAAQLTTDDFKRILAMCPRLERLTLNMCGQFKDAVIDYMLERPNRIKHLKLEECNLVTDAKWRQLFAGMGAQLQTLKLTWLDSSLDDETLEHLVAGCPNLTYLKLKKCFRLTTASLASLAKLQKLEHLALHLKQPVEQDDMLALIRAVGPNLRTLSLERFYDLDDALLDTIRASCKRLQKLRLTNMTYLTDGGFTRLFSGWAAPALASVDLHDVRHVESIQPDGPADDEDSGPVGLASEGFAALMRHSGSRLEKLNIKACRHVSQATLMEAFDGNAQYPCLREVDMSFVKHVDTTVVAGLFRSCPAAKKVVTFGCFGVGEVVVPQGVALIGIPDPRYGIEQKGEFYIE